MTDKEITLPTRRGFIVGLGALFCAPAFVRADSIMRVSPIPPEELFSRLEWIGDTIIMPKKVRIAGKLKRHDPVPSSLDFLPKRERGPVSIISSEGMTKKQFIDMAMKSMYPPPKIEDIMAGEFR